ncbi:MAG: hypothetical protein KDD35_03475 [Bdellovibrionales bacterium]|nr:hypothetical protein [Bdellovibrionales bacterium]
MGDQLGLMRLTWGLLIALIVSGISVLALAGQSRDQEVSHSSLLALKIPVNEKVHSDCSDIQGRLQQFGDLGRKNQEELSQYLSDLSQIMKAWHADLEPLEGNNVFIAKGSFSPIANTSVNVELSAQISQQNAENLYALFDELMKELPSCLK